MSGELNDWQERVVVEEAELTDRCFRLSEFLGDPEKVSRLAPEEVARLKTQLFHMREYSKVLSARILEWR